MAKLDKERTIIPHIQPFVSDFTAREGRNWESGAIGGIQLPGSAITKKKGAMAVNLSGSSGLALSCVEAILV